MKRAGRLIESIADPDNLRLAFWKARKGKSHARIVEKYRQDLDCNLLRLREQILSGLVDVGRYHRFKIFDPKERLICAPSFQEQVLHHAVINICHEHFEKKLIFDSYACRKGKGTYAALARAKTYTERYAWFLKLDVKKFFDSIHHEVLKAQLAAMFKDYRVLEIFEKIIESYEAQPGRGLPIGNLSSQYFANHYLSGLDHYVKESLRIKAYARYMDDMALWSDDKDALKMARKAIEDYVRSRLLCELKPVLLNRSALGLPFLGYRLFPDHLVLNQQSKRRFLKKMKTLEENFHAGLWDEATCQRRALPLLAFVRHAETNGLRNAALAGNDGRAS